jgi:hypothetical protein
MPHAHQQHPTISSTPSAPTQQQRAQQHRTSSQNLLSSSLIRSRGSDADPIIRTPIGLLRGFIIVLLAHLQRRWGSEPPKGGSHGVSHTKQTPNKGGGKQRIGPHCIATGRQRCTPLTTGLHTISRAPAICLGQRGDEGQKRLRLPAVCGARPDS